MYNLQITNFCKKKKKKKTGTKQRRQEEYNKPDLRYSIIVETRSPTLFLEQREIDQRPWGETRPMLCLRNSSEKRHSLLSFVWHPFVREIPLNGRDGRKMWKNSRTANDRSRDTRHSRLFSRSMSVLLVTIAPIREKLLRGNTRKTSR